MDEPLPLRQRGEVYQLLMVQIVSLLTITVLGEGMLKIIPMRLIQMGLPSIITLEQTVALIIAEIQTPGQVLALCSTPVETHQEVLEVPTLILEEAEAVEVVVLEVEAVGHPVVAPLAPDHRAGIINNS